MMDNRLCDKSEIQSFNNSIIQQFSNIRIICRTAERRVRGGAWPIFVKSTAVWPDLSVTNRFLPC
jgi:hypothetical protein